jgi:hypothetical protein
MLYDYKSEDYVQDIILDSYNELADDIFQEYNALRRNQELSMYAPAYVARQILGILLDDYYEDFYVDDESECHLLHDDENEVLITIADDGRLFIEETRGYDGKLISSDGFSALNYIHDSFKKKDIDYLALEEDSILVFGFEDEDGYNDRHNEKNCEKCSERFECDDYTNNKEKSSKKLTTTSSVKEKFTLNGNEVSKKEFIEAIEDIENEYLDSVHDFLLSWCHIQDELNDWRKFFY